MIKIRYVKGIRGIAYFEKYPQLIPAKNVVIAKNIN